MTVETVSDITAARIREVRKQRRWQPADLALRCKELGAGHVTENVIENIEGGRRSGGRRRRAVTVDELLAVALALDVAPVHLLVPTDDDGRPYPVTAGVQDTAFMVREWIRGTIKGGGLPGVDRLRYLITQPDHERGRLRVIEEGDDDGER